MESGAHSLLTYSLSSLAWSLQRSDPEAAVARLDELLEVNGDQTFSGVHCTALRSPRGLKARLGDQQEAFAMLYPAALIARDEGVRPQLGAILDWSVLAFVRTGRPDIAVVFLGILTQGVLADVSNYLLTGAYSRDDAIERLRPVIGDDGEFDALVDRGAGMSYDEVVVYVLEELSTERV